MNGTVETTFASIFMRLHPLVKSGPAAVSFLLDGKRTTLRGRAVSANAGLIADQIARTLPQLRAAFKRVVMVIETPDHVSHFVRVV